MKKIQERKWEIAPTIPVEVEKDLANYPKIFRQILFNRGIKDSESAERFLNADYELFDPYLMVDMGKAINIIRSAVKKKEVIVVFGDYDVDGVTATTLLVQALWSLGANALKFIPNRFMHGYGFSFDALEEVLELNPDLIITMDCGVRSVEEVAAAKDAGVKVIITDHHQPFIEIPQADAILCPRMLKSQYPNKDLAGVGIAYKLAQALDYSFPEKNIKSEFQLDLVALGTIADMAKLTPENRLLVKKGLHVVQSGNRPGIAALSNVCGLDIERTKAEDIGFRLGPRLNAAGRLKTAEDAYQLLIAEDREHAAPYAIKLDQSNRDRQSITRNIQELAEEWVVEHEQEWVLFHASEEFNEGVVGLVASRLVEIHYCPAIIGGINDGVIRASCRSIPEINITKVLDECEDLLIQHGGHAMAAGLSLEIEKKNDFYKRISRLIEERLDGLHPVPVIKAECELSLFDLKPELLEMLDQLEPTGEGNPRSQFVSRGVQVRYPKTVGANNDHLKFSVKGLGINNKGLHGSITFDAIAFRMGLLIDQLTNGSIADIIYYFEKNVYKGREKLQLNIQDIKIKQS